MNEMKQISSDDFFNLQSSGINILIVDARPYIVYNTEHIQGACNMYCPPILKRRFTNGGNVKLESMLNSETKHKMLSGHFHKIVIYDDVFVSGGEISDLYVVWRCLCNIVGTETCYVLNDGFQDFRLRFPHLCHRQTTENTSNNKENIDKSSRQALYRTNSTQSDPVELLSHLYIGDASNAACKDDLLQLGITAILNVSSTCRNHFHEDFRYKNIPVDDNKVTDLSQWFQEAISFIDSVKMQGGKTLVHCQAGISRSATICLAYIMYTERLSLDAAFEYVKSRRNVISPNVNFMQQLHNFEKEILHKTVQTPKLSPCRIYSVSSP
ncbi:hypothetical protein KUTeg_004944, partial [Tegillarca granosa]